MAYAVTALVRRARLPKAMRCRPLAKLCLLSLADRCDEHGHGAWPSLATIAAEAEVEDTRTITARLNALAAAGLIVELEPPRQRRPRVWGLNLAALDQLASRLPLIDTPPEVQTDAPLDDPAPPPEVQIPLPGVQVFGLGVQPVAPDPVLLDPVRLIPRANAVELGPARAVIRELLASDDRPTGWDAITALAERECRSRGVDLGQPGDHVIAKAYVLEHIRAKLQKAEPPRLVPSSRRAG